MRTLKIGSNGPDVKDLQTNLRIMGYNLTPDGIFGNNTFQIVVQFQTSHNLSPDGVVGINTWTVLNEEVQELPVYGIDVSHHNGVINWNKVNPEQVQFVYCKATQGKTYKDEMFQTNFNELTRLKYKRGAYHFFTFSGVSAKDQIDNFLGCGIDFSSDEVLPAVLDIEWQQGTALNEYVKNNRSICVAKITDWLDGIKIATGKTPVIYTAKGFWNDILGNPTGFEKYPLWVASYRNDKPTMPGNWIDFFMWQFTESASVEGIIGNVDKDIAGKALINLLR